MVFHSLYSILAIVYFEPKRASIVTLPFVPFSGCEGVQGDIEMFPLLKVRF